VPVAASEKFAAPTPLAKGTNVQTSDDILISTPPRHCANAVLLLIVTPVSATSVVVPAPRLSTRSWVSATHATVACLVTVTVLAAALLIVRSFV
jgi:hypothetical protein